MPGAIAELPKQELFARLAEGHAAGITVVTPNRRLARSLRGDFDVFQANKNLSVWEDVDILPLDAFVERLYEDALYTEPAGGQPQLLSEAQAQALWESVLGASGLLAVAGTAERCAEAWTLAHRWRIDGAIGKVEGSDDARAFAGWAQEYARRCRREGWLDAARLPDFKGVLAGRKPKLLVAYAFDVLPPQSKEFLNLFQVAFCGPEKKEATQIKAHFPSARHELEAAAKWARAGLERGAQRIGLVVPDLGRRRREVVRVLSGVICPGYALPGAPRAALPFDVSLGEPLNAFPIVAFALSLLELSFGEIEFEAASRLIRSPFIGGAESARAARARLDAKLRRRLGARVSLPKLIAGVDGALRFHLEKVFAIAKPQQGTPDQWAQIFTTLLEAAGFPGERALDSAEFQARAKLSEVLGDFAKLTFVSGKVPGEKAIEKLKHLCSAVLFQPESPQAPVQVLGALESLGIGFDALWVSGMTEGAWPLRAGPNPFLPVALQRKAGIPEASAETSLARAKQITAAWRGGAREVVWSWPEREEDRDLLPSPLIAQIPQDKVEIPGFVSYRDLVFHGKKTETIQDEKAPAAREKTVRGGTRVLADQAACPFRAFARWRLGAEALEAPSRGPDAADRGRLLHALMAEIWRELKDSKGLKADFREVLSRSAAKAVRELRIEGRLAEMEIERLAKLAGEWLALERQRDAFEVVQIEKKIPIEICGLSLQGRIDRMDRLADGSHALIDYKSGRVSVNDWLEERPDDPQLPLYALAAGEEIAALAFAKLKTGEMGFAGLSRADDLIPGVEGAASWDRLFRGWKKEIEKLARAFAHGDARVNPKRSLNTCRNCDLQPLCRVHERLDALAADDGEGA